MTCSLPHPSSDSGATKPPVHRVLLVDDQKLVAAFVRRNLAVHPDFVFEFCADADAATAVAEAFQPTVILQDLVMGEIDGLEMVRRYRAIPGTFLNRAQTTIS